MLDGIMLGLGSVVGAGLFVATGLAVRQAGPAVLLAFAIGGVALVGVLTGLAEMAATNPATGGLRTYAREAFGPWLGFVIGWMYWSSGVLTMSSEVTAASLIAHLWFPHTPLWTLSIFFSIIITAVNFMDTRGFGKVEDGLAVVKVAALVAFTLIGAYFLTRGAGAGLRAIAAEGPGLARFFPTGLRGLGASMLMVMFAYAGVQVVAMAAPETRDPPRTVPRLIRGLIITVLVLYFSAFTVLLLVIPWRELTPGVSPFVQALQRLGLLRIDGVFALVILTAALSSLNSALFSVSRMLRALALDGEAPRAFAHESKFGVPTWSTAASGVVLALAALVAYALPHQAYVLITSASGFIAMFNWTVIALTHVRYRPVLLRQKSGGLVYRAWGYPYLSLLTAAIAVGVLLTTPLVPGQLPGLIVGTVQFGLVNAVYFLFIRNRHRPS
ncbi:MAG: amino acid permease [Bacillota bacterium]